VETRAEQCSFRLRKVKVAPRFDQEPEVSDEIPRVCATIRLGRKVKQSRALDERTECSSEVVGNQSISYDTRL